MEEAPAGLYLGVSGVQSIEEIAAKRKVRHMVEMINQDPPATCSQEVSSGLFFILHSPKLLRSLPCVKAPHKQQRLVYGLWHLCR